MQPRRGRETNYIAGEHQEAACLQQHEQVIAGAVTANYNKLDCVSGR